MKFVCEKNTLLDAVSKVGRAVAGKSVHPSLEGILLKAGNASLYLAGYDLELGITTRIEADVEEPGNIVLNAKLFGDIVRRSPSDEVEVTVDEKLNVYIKSGKSEFHILGISAAEYPELPTVDEGTGFTLPQSTLGSMIRQTIFAVSQNDARPVHKGILFEMEENTLRLVAVDGSRLALRCEKVNNVEEMKFVIPGKTLLEVMKLLNDEDSPVSLAVGRRHVVMEINGYAVISRLLEGEFLSYKKAIPADFGTVIRVKTRDLMDAVDRASLVISDSMKSPLVCYFSDGEVKLSCTTSTGSVNDSLPANVDGEAVEIGFNSRYITDALRNTECDEIRIEVKGALAPMKILPVEGDAFLFMVLPVRLKK
ncbi:MAG: DNA polymerase III subunit beta [Clostridia bacterium]|nr:DNA polymerase III subunit beta [Clostridia bacterium]